MSTVALAYDVTGPEGAPPLVLSGSLGTHRGMWDAQVPALAERFRVIRYDQRGHGASPVPAGPYAIEDLGGDVLALLDDLGIERASFCGLSIGGMTGMWLAAHAPGRVDRLVAVCTSAYLPPAEGWADRARTVRQAGTVAAIADTVVQRWFTPGFAAERPDIFGALRDMCASTPPEGYAACCEAIAGMDLRDDLPRIDAPTLVVSGAEDPATPPGHGRLIADAVPRARFAEVPDAAHLANIQQPAAVTNLILDHLDTLEAP